MSKDWPQFLSEDERDRAARSESERILCQRLAAAREELDSWKQEFSRTLDDGQPYVQDALEAGQELADAQARVRMAEQGLAAKKWLTEREAYCRRRVQILSEEMGDVLSEARATIDFLAGSLAASRALVKEKDAALSQLGCAYELTINPERCKSLSQDRQCVRCQALALKEADMRERLKVKP